MIEFECPTCRIPLHIPESVMGQSGTCKHCGEHFKLPSLLRYRVVCTWEHTKKNAFPAAMWALNLPFRFLSHLVRVNSKPDDLEGLSQAERLLVLEARKQTKVQKANRSDTTCCLGCLILLLLLIFTPFLGTVLAILGIGGIAASQ